MLPNLLVAVTSTLLLAGASFASDPYYFKQLVFKPAQSSASMRLEGDILPGSVRQIGISEGTISSDGLLHVDMLLNVFGADAEIQNIHGWYKLQDGFQRPQAKISAQLTRSAILHAMAGPGTTFELPLQIELNGAPRSMTAIVTGQVQTDGTISISTYRPLPLEVSGPGSAKADLHFSLVYNRGNQAPTPTPATAPELLANAQPAPVIDGLSQVLRPRIRPKSEPAPRRVVVAVKPRPTQPSPRKTQTQKQIVKITHTMRPKTIAKSSTCANQSRVARQETLLQPLPEERANTKVDRALRRIVRAIMPCKG